MKLSEKQQKLHSLSEEMRNLKRIMRASDEYANKCQKLNKIFKEEYPLIYDVYITANKQYNEREEEYKRISQIEPEDDEIPNIE
ncbi:MAG: hypothetical protein ACI4N3_00860 [Alphaproteobacteria bacterium]